MAKILVTGGAGYIGSHTCLELLNSGYEVSVIDNLSNSSYESIRRVEQITGKKIDFHNLDVREEMKLLEIFSNNHFDGVIHFAGLKAVGESVNSPLEYYQNNVSGTLALFNVMKKYNCRVIVFSSSATVYGKPSSLPIKENFPLKVTNPYGRSKLVVEEILRDLHFSDTSWSIGLLRYFNPIGAHESGLIGEDPRGIPNNLLPFVAQVAIGKRKEVIVHGDDYDTIDGTGVRDYIHVVDLALGHIKSLELLINKQKLITVNFGTGNGYSVLEIIRTYESVCKKEIPFKISTRRAGDIDSCYADVGYAKKILHWKAERSLYDMCKDSWNWQVNNPDGFS